MPDPSTVAVDFDRQMARISVVLRADTVRLERQLASLARDARRAMSSPRPAWLDADPPTFAFPGWGPAWRPFDWSVDA